MKAIRTHEPTGISGLVFEEAPDPKPMFCEVLVKVAACGITHNELDWPIWTCRAGHQRTSVIPGHEVSGVVAALGFGTAGIAVGDEVFGLTDQLRDGAAAEYVAVEARNVASKPQAPRPRPRRGGAAGRPDGVAGPVRPRKAGQGADGGHPRRGRRGRIDGGPACPLGRREVIGTWCSHSRPLVTELGADRFIALGADRLEDAADQADLVFDAIGGEVLARSPALLKPGGTLVTIKADALCPLAGTTSGRLSSSRNPAALS